MNHEYFWQISKLIKTWLSRTEVKENNQILIYLTTGISLLDGFRYHQGLQVWRSRYDCSDPFCFRDMAFLCFFFHLKKKT